jgi:post-segregation antitoxin (ccd killing protein)
MRTTMVKKPRMRVTLYLPDELRERANKAGLNLSGLLREAVERELRGDAPGIRSSGRRVKQSVELTVTVPIETVRELIDERDRDV